MYASTGTMLIETAVSTMPTLSTVEAITVELRINPLDSARALALVDARIEAGEDAKTAKRTVKKLVGEWLVKAATAKLFAEGKDGSKLRGMICRKSGATNRLGKPLTCVRYVVKATKSKPVYEGSSWYYTTPSGSPVQYPNAYRRAYGKPVYHAADHVVTVGAYAILTAKVK